jgi:drug/metabolite transporter (DMT)-like permease
VTLLALALVVVAAAGHATWNLLVKRSVDKLAFLWCSGVAGMVLFLPVVLYVSPAWDWLAGAWPTVLSSAVVRGSYFATLGTAYTRGDLSLVYPLARGASTAVVPLLAILLLGERLSVPATVGVAVVAIGIYVLHLPSFSVGAMLTPLRALARPHAWWALATAALTITYSLVDKWSMNRGMPPLAYAYLTIPAAALLLTPHAVGYPAAVAHEWRAHRTAIVAVALLVTSGYLLVLVALTFAPLSVIAPARELGIVFGAALGTTLLGEPHGRVRITGAALIVLGIALLAV